MGSIAELTPSQGALGDFTSTTYHPSPTLTDVIAHVHAEAKKQGLTGHDIALRWIRFHSALKPGLGDAMIVGASSPAQLESTMKSLDIGPLPGGCCEGGYGVWETARERAPDYSPFLRGCHGELVAGSSEPCADSEMRNTYNR